MMICTFIHAVESSQPLRSTNQSLMPVITWRTSKIKIAAFKVRSFDCLTMDVPFQFSQHRWVHHVQWASSSEHLDVLDADIGAFIY